MKRGLPGLSQAALPTSEVPDGTYLVRVERMQYRWDKQKPYYAARFQILQPAAFANASFSARLYCTSKALWKLSWFLRDFGYDQELFAREELDEQAMIGLTGVVKISHTVANGRTYTNLEAFAAAARWNDFEPASSEVA